MSFGIRANINGYSENNHLDLINNIDRFLPNMIIDNYYRSYTFNIYDKDHKDLSEIDRKLFENAKKLRFYEGLELISKEGSWELIRLLFVHKNKSSILCYTSQYNRLDIMKNLLNLIESIYDLDSCGEKAIMHNNLIVLCHILKKGKQLDINRYTICLDSFIYFCAKKNELGLIKHLIKELKENSDILEKEEYDMREFVYNYEKSIIESINNQSEDITIYLYNNFPWKDKLNKEKFINETARINNLKLFKFFENEDTDINESYFVAQEHESKNIVEYVNKSINEKFGLLKDLPDVLKELIKTFYLDLEIGNWKTSELDELGQEYKDELIAKVNNKYDITFCTFNDVKIENALNFHNEVYKPDFVKFIIENNGSMFFLNRYIDSYEISKGYIIRYAKHIGKKDFTDLFGDEKDYPETYLELRSDFLSPSTYKFP